jgi:predicted transcriptional regulator
MSESDKLSLISTIAANYLRRNPVGVDQIGAVISSITGAIQHAADQLAGHPVDATSEAAAPAIEKPTPAVSIKKSIQPEFLVCLEDGVHARTLKRHLTSAHGMTPAQYRERWALPKDYPMSAPAYSAQRSEMAKQIGLGQRGRGAKGRVAKSKTAVGGRKART